MSDFRIEFSLSPWILLLIIPALAFTLFLYFRVEKRFRRLRRRRLSLALHIVILICAITAFSGLRFTWQKDDVENELVILVDQSYSDRSSRERADAFVRDVISANEGRSRLAVVKFGFDQVLAVEMGKHNASRAYDEYLHAEDPNTTATDIRSALSYVWDPATGRSGGETGKPLISDPKSARILLISDGLQTDRDAMSVSKLMALDGIRIDASFFPANYSNDVWIANAEYPDRSFDLGEKFEFDLTIHSSYSGSFDVKFSDNGDLAYSKEGVNLRAGLQTVKIPHAFTKSGHHELKFSITSTGDSTVENNVFYTSYDLEEYNSILILEKYPGESDELVDIIKSRADAEYLTLRVQSIEEAPRTIETLSQYDEVILVNIARKDMTDEFEKLLYEYVYNRGGGLYTVGGFERDEDGEIVTTLDKEGKEKPVPHAYNEADLKDSLYQEMLPVKIEEYRPPTALAILIDRSASMEDNFERPAEEAIKGALAAVNTMSTRDFVGVMTMQTSYHMQLDLTPMTQKSKIIDAIYRVEDEVGGSNSEIAAIEHASRALGAMRSVERKHILFLTDGRPGDPARQYQEVMRKYYEQFEITITIVSVVDPILDELNVLAQIGHGGAYHIPYNIEQELPDKLKRDIGYEDLSGAVCMEYTPTLNAHTPVVDKMTQSQLDELDMDGFFVSRVKNSTVQVPLMAKYVPMYAQWKFGEGKVGSLMVDLFGHFSEGLITNEDVGRPILNNIVSSLMPVMNIRERTLNVSFIEDNYRTQVSVEGYNHDSEKDKKLIAFVKSPSGEISKFDLSDLSPGGNRFTFENFEPGIHDVTVMKVPRSFNVFGAGIKDADDVADRYVMAIIHTYRAFSYSEEYNASRDSFTEGKELLIGLSSRTDVEGEEKLIESADEFVSTLVDLRKSYDPRYLLMGIAVVLFLIEIAIRKFNLPKLRELLFKLRKKLGLEGKSGSGAA